MADIWIVTSYKFTPHYSFEIAEAEAMRLRQKHPGTDFRVLRVKTHLKPTGNYGRLQKIGEAVKKLFNGPRKFMVDGNKDQWDANDFLKEQTSLSGVKTDG